MTRLTVVSRNAALPFALNSAGHEVVVVSDDADVRWAEFGFAEIVVLDIDDPAACELLVDDLASSPSVDEVRVLLLASKNPAWGRVLSQTRTGVAVLPLPLSMQRLDEAITSLMHGPPLGRVAGIPLTGTVPEQASPAEQPPPVPAPVPEPEPPVVIALPEPEPEPEPEIELDLQPEPAPEPAPVRSWSKAASISSATVGYYEVRTAPHREPDPEPAPAVVPQPEAEPVAADPAPAEPPGALPRVAPPPPRAASLVRSLSACVGDLASVGDTGAVVCSEACRIVDADAAAVMVRDGAVWRVAAGQELRPLEHRLVIEATHWLVKQVSDTEHGIILSGGEGRWAELYGVPLSGRAHLLAAPLGHNGAILLLARDDGEFQEFDLAALTDLREEAGQLLSDAVDVRRLARQLSAFTDED